MEEPIFELRENSGYYYHGIVTGILDSKTVSKFYGLSSDIAASAEFFGMIWNDEQNKYLRGRFKFPSGNKLKIDKVFNYDTSIKEILSSIDEINLSDRQYYPCNTGSLNEMLEIMRKKDLILSERTEKI